MNNKIIKAKIKYILEKEGKNMKWLAEQLNISPQDLNAIFSGKSITIDKIEYLLAPIGYKLDIVIEKEN